MLVYTAALKTLNYDWDTLPLDLEPCTGGGDATGEALTEALAGRLLSREILRFGCRPCGQKGKAISIVASSQAACGPGAVGEPVHIRKLLAREPGDLGNACREGQAGGGRLGPYAPRARRRGVGAGGSTEERFEQGRVSVGGESGGKRPRQGERGPGPHGPSTAAGSRVPGAGSGAASRTKCAWPLFIRGKSRMS